MICYRCAEFGTSDRQAAIKMSSELRGQTLKGQIVLCEVCKEYKSIWKNIDSDGCIVGKR